MVNLRRGVWLGVGGACLLISGGLAFYHHFKRREALPVKKDAFQGFIQGRGEEALKKRTAMTFAAVYEKMIAQYPENLELKKKLAETYQDAGQYDKARPLLEEISKSESKQKKP